MNLQHQEQQRSEPAQTTGLILPFAAIRKDMLALVGGKGANLGEMASTGLPVPPGFCITTLAYEQVATAAGLEALLAAREQQVHSPEHLAELARAAHACIQSASMPEHVALSISEAYHLLGAGEPIPVAVRSSATTEDLPFASFAGQQDTYLNIVGIEAVLDAVQRCWASLWTERAVSYRASLNLDQRVAQLAIVVQLMVEAEVAGVLFTANPVTGQRRQAVIDANPGLGEAVVSGATNPDHFVVNTARGEIVEQQIGDKRLVIRGDASGGTVHAENDTASATACLSGAQIRSLAQLGARVEAHYGTPQDIEWAIDAGGALWLTQSRPITTLYPLPANAPENDEELRVYLSLNVFQGVLRPLTPMSMAIFRLIGSTVAAGLFNLQVPDPLRGPGVLVEAGSRLFFDVTPALRTTPGRRFLLGAMGFGEARSGVLLQRLLADPRLSLKPMPRWRVIRAFGALARRTRAPFVIFQALVRPASVVRRLQQTRAELELLRAERARYLAGDPTERLQVLEQILSERAGRLFRRIPPVLISGLGSLGLASRLLKGLATSEELQIVTRALPHNPTTEMDLALWMLSRQVAGDDAAARAVLSIMPEQLAQAYHAGTLPSILQQGLSEFLSHYGHRGVAEIDLGLPRWQEDPTHILGVLANYLRMPPDDTPGASDNQDPSRRPALLSPHAQFQKGAREAEAMVAELTRRARSKGRVRGLLVGFFLQRMRELAGLREMPKFCLVLLLAALREMLQSIGKDLAEAGYLEDGSDIFFLTLQETRTALAGANMRELVHARQADYHRELQRRHVPRVLLSNGTEPSPSDSSHGNDTQDTLRGTPASPGHITGQARVILDPTGAHLEPGEILVAPSTDPGWTPLFLTAGGLVMEMGGAISHGAVVAREYGIPAVVGVAGATERIVSGQQITIDGASGTITLEKR